MSFQEKRSLVLFGGSLLLAFFYLSIVFQQLADAPSALADSPAFWAKAILLMIPVMIGVKILLYILSFIIQKAVASSDTPEFQDEMDKLIDLKTAQHTYTFFGLFFLAFLAALALEWPNRTAFAILLCGMFVTDMFREVSQFYYYRKGC